MGVDYEIKDSRLHIHKDGKTLGIIDYSIYYNLRERVAMFVSIINGEIHADFPGSFLVDTIKEENDTIIVKRKWTLKRVGIWQLPFRYTHTDKSLTKWSVPSVSYYENKEGEGKFPRGGIEKKWSFREDRIPIPSASAIYNQKEFAGVFTDPAKDMSILSSVKTYKSEEGSVFEIRIPFSEEPFAYTEKGVLFGGLSTPAHKYLLLSPANTPYTLEKTYYITIANIKHQTDIYSHLYFTASTFFEKETSKPQSLIKESNWNKISSLRFNHLKYLLIDSSKSRICGIKMGKGNNILQAYYEFTGGSFLIKSLEAATIFARAYEDTGNEEYLSIAERMGNFFLEGKLENGLHYDMYDLRKSKWGGYFGATATKEHKEGVNTRANGEAMYSYIRLYEILKRNSIVREDFLQIAKDNARFYVENQLTGEEEGNYGRWWSKEGKPINTLGTNGAYIIPMLIQLMKVSGESESIKISLIKAGEYYKRLIDRNGFYADTLDADCVDKEAGCILLRAFLDLYAQFNDESYLQYAKYAASFVLGWTWVYDVAFEEERWAYRANIKTRGITGVSVAHHHLDFYGTYIGLDMLRLYKYTKDERYERLAYELIGSCTQIISTPKVNFGRNKNFIGWQPEQVNQTNWDYFHRIAGSKGKYHSCCAWNVVLNLGALLDIREQFSNVLSFTISDNILD